MLNKIDVESRFGTAISQFDESKIGAIDFIIHSFEAESNVVFV